MNGFAAAVQGRGCVGVGAGPVAEPGADHAAAAVGLEVVGVECDHVVQDGRGSALTTEALGQDAGLADEGGTVVGIEGQAGVEGRQGPK